MRKWARPLHARQQVIDFKRPPEVDVWAMAATFYRW
jgi:hypothetical protein